MSVLNTPFPHRSSPQFFSPARHNFKHSHSPPLLESFLIGIAIDEGEANVYLGTVGLPKVNDFQGMSLEELTINYSKVSVLSGEHELQLGILKSFSKACVDQFSATIEKQIRERGPRAKKKIMQEIKSSLDAARKAQQSGKHQTSMGTPYPNSRSQQDARWQWVKRKAKPLEDVAIAAVVAFL